MNVGRGAHRAVSDLPSRATLSICTSVSPVAASGMAVVGGQVGCDPMRRLTCSGLRRPFHSQGLPVTKTARLPGHPWAGPLFHLAIKFRGSAELPRLRDASQASISFSNQPTTLGLIWTRFGNSPIFSLRQIVW